MSRRSERTAAATAREARTKMLIQLGGLAVKLGAHNVIGVPLGADLTGHFSSEERLFAGIVQTGLDHLATAEDPVAVRAALIKKGENRRVDLSTSIGTHEAKKRTLIQLGGILVKLGAHTVAGIPIGADVQAHFHAEAGLVAGIIQQGLDRLTVAEDPASVRGALLKKGEAAMLGQRS